MVFWTAVLAFIGGIFGKTWDTTRDFVSWLVLSMPAPMKFFFFLYMVLFLASTIIPIFLGASFSCDTQGNIYKMNFVQMLSAKQIYENNAEICATNTTAVGTTFWDVLGLGEWYNLNVNKVWSFFLGNPTPEDRDEICKDFDNIPANVTASGDYALYLYGTRNVQSDYENAVHVGCVQKNDGSWYVSLLFFSINLFDFKLWLLLGICGMLVSFSNYWYKMILKR